MAYLINQVDVLTRLHNLMGKRVAPGGTDEDLKRWVQDGFDYCWRYYRWSFAQKAASIADDGVLPEDFDLLGYFDLADTYTPTWDSATGRLILDPIAEVDINYQIAPPTLGTDEAGSAPFPSARVVAMAALIYAKLSENPTRADIQQEWDLLHSELDRLTGYADRNTPRRPVNFHDVAGTHTGDVGG